MIFELYAQLEEIKKDEHTEPIKNLMKEYDLIMPRKRDEEEKKNRKNRRKNGK